MKTYTGGTRYEARLVEEGEEPFGTWVNVVDPDTSEPIAGEDFNEVSLAAENVLLLMLDDSPDFRNALQRLCIAAVTTIGIFPHKSDHDGE